MTHEQMIARAAVLEAAAAVNDAYRRRMEETTDRTGGALGHIHNPSAYAAHGLAASRKRAQAADLRAQAGPTPAEVEAAETMMGDVEPDLT